MAIPEDDRPRYVKPPREKRRGVPNPRVEGPPPEPEPIMRFRDPRDQDIEFYDAWKPGGAVPLDHFLMSGKAIPPVHNGCGDPDCPGCRQDVNKPDTLFPMMGLSAHRLLSMMGDDPSLCVYATAAVVVKDGGPNDPPRLIDIGQTRGGAGPSKNPADKLISHVIDVVLHYGPAVLEWCVAGPLDPVLVDYREATGRFEFVGTMAEARDFKRRQAAKSPVQFEAGFVHAYAGETPRLFWSTWGVNQVSLFTTGKTRLSPAGALCHTRKGSVTGIYMTVDRLDAVLV